MTEVGRCRDGDSLAQIRSVLDGAGIAYRTASTAATFDIAAIGSGGEADVIVSVRKADYAAARAAMEEEFLSADLPPDHYLLGFSDDELVEVLGKADEWSPHDVAHARRLAAARGIDESAVRLRAEEKVQSRRNGKPASRALLIAGWIFSLLGGLIGLGIAWSICYMKDKTPEGEFFTYDERSRARARPMLAVASVVTGIDLLLRFTDILPK